MLGCLGKGRDAGFGVYPLSQFVFLKLVGEVVDLPLCFLVVAFENRVHRSVDCIVHAKAVPAEALNAVFGELVDFIDNVLAGVDFVLPPSLVDHAGLLLRKIVEHGALPFSPLSFALVTYSLFRQEKGTQCVLSTQCKHTLLTWGNNLITGLWEARRETWRSRGLSRCVRGVFPSWQPLSS